MTTWRRTLATMCTHAPCVAFHEHLSGVRRQRCRKIRARRTLHRPDWATSARYCNSHCIIITGTACTHQLRLKGVDLRCLFAQQLRIRRYFGVDLANCLLERCFRRAGPRCSRVCVLGPLLLLGGFLGGLLVGLFGGLKCPFPERRWGEEGGKMRADASRGWQKGRVGIKQTKSCLRTRETIRRRAPLFLHSPLGAKPKASTQTNHARTRLCPAFRPRRLQPPAPLARLSASCRQLALAGRVKR